MNPAAVESKERIFLVAPGMFGWSLEGGGGYSWAFQPQEFMNEFRCRIYSRTVLLITTVFDDCDELARVCLVGGIHKTIYSLHLESWRNEMNDEIKRINRALPTLNAEGTRPRVSHSGFNQSCVKSIISELITTDY